MLVALGDTCVVVAKHRGVYAFAHNFIDFFLARPDITKINFLPLMVFTKRLGEQIVVDASGQRVCHDQWRRHQVVSANLRVDAPFEVAIAGKHRDNHELMIVDGFGHICRQRAGIADAGCASISGDAEAETVEELHQPSLLVILGHDARSGSNRRLHPGRRRETTLDRILRQDSGRHHDVGV